MNFVCPNSALGSAFSIGADPPELSHGSKEVGLIVIHFLGSLLFTVAKAFPAYIGLKKVSADIIFVTSAKSDDEARELLKGFDFPFNAG